MNKKIIAVVGASGNQGSGVVDALLESGLFHVRAISRIPENYDGNAHEAMKGDLTDLESLTAAFQNAYGVFIVTNFWEGADELAQGKIAIEAARNAGVRHYIWSTLPNVEAISEGKYHVPHFSEKAKVDELIKMAGFEYYTFVQAPFYFQNLTGQLGAQIQENGSMGWSLPIEPSKRVIHMADIHDLGKVVAGAFIHPEKTGKGSYLSLAADRYSFDDILSAFRAKGKEYSFNYIPGEVFSKFPFEGAAELAHMFAYFEANTYMGPGAEDRIRMAKELSTGTFNTLENWIEKNVN